MQIRIGMFIGRNITKNILCGQEVITFCIKGRPDVNDAILAP